MARRSNVVFGSRRDHRTIAHDFLSWVWDSGVVGRKAKEFIRERVAKLSAGSSRVGSPDVASREPSPLFSLHPMTLDSRLPTHSKRITRTVDRYLHRATRLDHLDAGEDHGVAGLEAGEDLDI